jgi:hypothetical protein
MIRSTQGNDIVSVVQIIVSSAEEDGNHVQFFQDGRALGAFTLADPDRLLAVLRQGGAEVTDLRAADDLAAKVASI